MADIANSITTDTTPAKNAFKENLNTFANEIINNITEYETLIHEFNQSGYSGSQAILLYYSPALLSNANGYYKRNNSLNSICDSLKTCLPFMQQVMQNTRSSVINSENGIITIMLRDAAMIASQNPEQLKDLEVNILGKDEAVVQKKLVK